LTRSSSTIPATVISFGHQPLWGCYGNRYCTSIFGGDVCCQSPRALIFTMLTRRSAGAGIDQTFRYASRVGCLSLYSCRKALPPITFSIDERQALEKSIAVSTYYDSEERPSSTECLPGTRRRQIKILMGRIEANKKEQPLFVVLGPSGSGKPVAPMCKEKKYLAASFFSVNTIAYHALFRCLWYLQTSSWHVSFLLSSNLPSNIRSSLKE